MTMIDKRIFYCWFGKGQKSKLNIDCIESWKKFCPDYEIIEINESNFDYRSTPYSIEGYIKHNWSAVSNTARLEYMCKENGFYLDTDIQLLKSLDELREYDGGFITEFQAGQPDAGILGRGTKCPILYQNAKNHMVKGTVMHKVLIRDLYSLYNIHGESIHTYEDGFTVLGEEYIPTIRSGFRNENTIAIHHYENTWAGHPIKITDNFYPFQRVQVWVNGKIIHEDKDPVVKFTINSLKRNWRNENTIGRINYFFNPKVVKIETKDFTAERIEWDREVQLDTTITVRGMVVSFIK